MAGAGFVRKYGYFPGVEELTAIEGVVIVDRASPGAIQGVSYGVVAAIGEASDMSYVCTVSGRRGGPVEHPAAGGLRWL